MIQITDTYGRILLDDDNLFEPLPGSVLLAKGLQGTAWQRHAKDGLWHSTSYAKPRDWEAMLTERNLILIYDYFDRGDHAA